MLAIDFGDFNDGNIEGAAAQIVHRNGVVALGLVHTVGQRRRRRLVDDAPHIQTGDLAGVFGGLTLGVVEIGRHGDDRLADRLAEELLGGFFHLAQHFGRHLRRGHLVALGFHPGIAVIGGDNAVGDHGDVFLHDIVLELAADQALDREQRVLGIGHGLALGALADQNFTVVGVAHDRRGGAIPLRVFDNARRIAI